MLAKFLARLCGLAARLKRDRRGNVATIFALSLIPILTAGGLAVDLSRAMVVRHRLAEALDAAGLAAGTQLSGTLDEIALVAQRYFDANYPDDELGVPGALTVTMIGTNIELSASATLETTLMSLVGIDTLQVDVAAEIVRSSMNVEVGLVVDVTGSMSGQKIVDLRSAANELVDIVVQAEQTPYYSKVALVPFSMGVNVGSYAAQVRGAVTPGVAIAGATWVNGPSKSITGITRANPAVVTSANHGLSNGDRIYISGVSGMSQVNNKQYTVANKTTNTFQLQGVNSSSYSSYSSGGTIRKCFTSACEVQITANSHGFANNNWVYITGAGGMTQINNSAWQVTSAAANTFILSGTNGPSYSNYTSGGTAWCTVAGCQYLRFTSATGSTKVFQISNCVSERTGSDAYTDAAPSTTLLGRVYPGSSNPCLSSEIVPLTSNKTTLTGEINSLTATGSTAGHIGLAWGWYMISPNFSYLWPGDSAPGAYGADHLLKVVVFMTDGEFNTPYCNGVIAADAGSGSGSSSDHINCDAPNGSSFSQAEALCDAIKAQGIILYTVGFDLPDTGSARDVLEACASDSEHFYIAESGVELEQAFAAIGQDITELRLAR